MSADGPIPNLEQHDFWAREGEHWVREVDRYDAMNAEFGQALLAAAGLQPGQRVLDVGCGNGATAIAAARRVAPGGEVLGIDLSAPMLALARRRAADAGCDNVRFLEGDAQICGFPERGFDAVVSRFGIMFFEDPEAAFDNLRRALDPDGHLVIVCWQDMFQSEWIVVPGAAAAEHVGLPDFGPPGTPGPFAFADENRIRRVLQSSGFRAITVEALKRPMRMGDDADDVVAFITSLELVRDTLFAGKPADKVEAAIAAARAAIVPYAGPHGVVMNGGAWLVSAKP